MINRPRLWRASVVVRVEIKSVECEEKKIDTRVYEGKKKKEYEGEKNWQRKRDTTGVQGPKGETRWVTTSTTREGKISGQETRGRFESNLSGVY